MSGKQPFIFLVVGEPSGDELGGRLMSALKDATQGNVRFAGVGGPAMAAQGLESLFPMRELSVMGIMEVLPHIPRILRRVRETAAAVNAQRPDLVVTIDSPTFAYRVVQRIDDPKIKRAHYVAPSVWAWRPWRVHKIGQCFDLVLALLPFEPPFFERVGVACTFVGHPVIEYGAADGDGVAFRRRHGVAEGEELICVLPGSRRSEVSRLGPEFGDTLALLAARRPRTQGGRANGTGRRTVSAPACRGMEGADARGHGGRRKIRGDGGEQCRLGGIGNSGGRTRLGAPADSDCLQGFGGDGSHRPPVGKCPIRQPD